MSEEAMKKRIEDGLRDQASIDIPLLGKQQLVNDSTISKYTKPIADKVYEWWGVIQNFFGQMFDSIFKWIAPEAYAKSKAQEAQAEAAKQQAEAITQVVVRDIEKDAPTLTAVQKAALRGAVAASGLNGQQAQLLSDTLGKAEWERFADKHPTTIKVAEAADNKVEVQLALPDGKSESHYLARAQ